MSQLGHLSEINGSRCSIRWFCGCKGRKILRNCQTFRRFFAKKFMRSSIIGRNCGAGGSRTLVRTRKPYAFYMLISVFVFVMQQDLSHQLHPYPLKIHPVIEAWKDYFRFNLRRWIFGFGTTSSERRLVLSPCDGIKLKIYCASIKQREHTHSCQLIFRPTWLWRTQSSLRMLTYHLGLPSNPVNPMVVTAKLGLFFETQPTLSRKITFFK